MLTQFKSRKTKSYLLDQNFWVDIVDECNVYSAWLYNDNYGIKELMFGMPKNQQTYEEFLNIVENNLDEYIEYYKEDHMDQED